MNIQANIGVARRRGGDRMLFVFVAVAAMHALLVFGVRFTGEELSQGRLPPSVEIIISQTANERTPEEADLLGRANSAGGDPDIEENTRRSDVFASFSSRQDLGAAPLVQEQLNAPAPTARAPDLLTVQASGLSVVSQPEAETEKQPVEINSAIDKQSMQIASLTQELRTMREKYARKSKILTLNSNTREYIAAEYVRDWIRAVESIGNTNLPTPARGLSGRVILEIGIDSRGQLTGSRVLRSSGHASLDDAALLSVKLASPFKAFSKKLRQRVDILNIVRTWHYDNSRLTAVTATKLDN
ncbi:MAG: TonB family protein [Gammaproteobacteria bacterium]|nr:TonB family protein [Gammaproteobacteria bacterium]